MKRDALPATLQAPATREQALTPAPREAGADSATRLALTSIQQGDTRAGLIAGGFGLLFLGIAALREIRREGGDLS